MMGKITPKIFLIVLATVVIAYACWLIINRQQSLIKNNEKEKIRPPIAGRMGFYPYSKKALSQEVFNLLSSASSEVLNGELLALIVPHAGYQYSGFTAAQAYRLITERSYETVVIVGPAHQAIVSGAAIDSTDVYETPLGKVKLDKEAADKLLKFSQSIYYDARVHAKEHSIEVQIPFLQTVLKDFKIVPILMGEFSWEYVESLSSALAKLAEEKNILIIVSSDLSHYHSYEQAVKMDRSVLDEVQKMDTQALYRKLKNGECEMCGALPVLTVIETVKKLGANKAKLIDYRNSGDVTGEKSRVVGYSALAFLKNLTLKSEKLLNEKEQKILLRIARQTLESYLKERKIPEFEVAEGKLKQEFGVFVTLKKNGNLRGCIGHIEGDRPLYQLVSQMAIASATQDPRFSPVRLDELAQIRIEISVLSPIKKVKNIQEIVVGRDGLIIKKGFSSGLLLPQVPVEWGWNRNEFLRQVSLKAGLEPDGWKNAELYRFTAQVFGEE